MTRRLIIGDPSKAWAFNKHLCDRRSPLIEHYFLAADDERVVLVVNQNAPGRLLNARIEEQPVTS